MTFRGYWMTNDIVHGDVSLEPLCARFINRPEFQRLRCLQQLGLTSWVFPSATHNRFAHSLGVAHLAGYYADKLSKESDIGISKKDILLLQVAGLCHDLGHGPFSHVFENVLLPTLKPGLEWCHEEMSVDLIDLIAEDAEEDWEAVGISTADFDMVKDLVCGTPGTRTPVDPDKRFLFDIVANKRNGIDVDKLDYLQRDSKMTNVQIRTTASRIMSCSRVILGKGDVTEICYRDREYRNVSEVFEDRQVLHEKVYTHRKVKAVELMVADVLALVDQELQVSDNVSTPRGFLLLDDTLITQARRLSPELGRNVQAAQQLLQRLDTRDLYQIAGEIVVSATAKLTLPTPEELVNYQHDDGMNTLRPEDVALCESRIDHGMKELNPMQNVGFCDYQQGRWQQVAVPATSVSTFLAPLRCYQERRIRVYCKDSSYNKVDNLKGAFRSWCLRNGVGEECMATPARTCKRPRADAAPAVPFPPTNGYGI